MPSWSLNLNHKVDLKRLNDVWTGMYVCWSYKRFEPEDPFSCPQAAHKVERVAMDDVFMTGIVRYQ